MQHTARQTMDISTIFFFFFWGLKVITVEIRQKIRDENILWLGHRLIVVRDKEEQSLGMI